jgi:hypothetical protein
MVEGYSNHMHFSIKDSCRVDAMAISEKLLRKVIFYREKDEETLVLRGLTIR